LSEEKPENESGNATIPPSPSAVYTDRPQDEIWHHIEKLKSLNYVREHNRKVLPLCS
jgi:hypothetical protein